LFSEWRDNPSFVLNDERFREATILVAGPNFGTGSSREHAVWAIQQYGFKAVISPRFADIFRNNCTKNGLVPVEVSDKIGEDLLQAIEDNPELILTVDVAKLTLEVPDANISCSFPLEENVQERFLKGLDDIGITMTHEEVIHEYQQNRPAWLPSISV
jgi:3-isopropylmalate/(R)-2-methylmalate dehydratase small subunit